MVALNDIIIFGLLAYFLISDKKVLLSIFAKGLQISFIYKITSIIIGMLISFLYLPYILVSLLQEIAAISITALYLHYFLHMENFSRLFRIIFSIKCAVGLAIVLIVAFSMLGFQEGLYVLGQRKSDSATYIKHHKKSNRLENMSERRRIKAVNKLIEKFYHL